jgi:hypothetical protein
VAVDAKAIDQAVAYLLMFAALFVTYFAHWSFECLDRSIYSLVSGLKTDTSSLYIYMMQMPVVVPGSSSLHSCISSVRSISDQFVVYLFEKQFMRAWWCILLIISNILFFWENYITYIYTTYCCFCMYVRISSPQLYPTGKRCTVCFCGNRVTLFAGRILLSGMH